MAENMRRILRALAGNPLDKQVPSILSPGDPTEIGYPATVGECTAYLTVREGAGDTEQQASVEAGYLTAAYGGDPRAAEHAVTLHHDLGASDISETSPDAVTQYEHHGLVIDALREFRIR